MKKLGKLLLKGVATALPLSLTLYAVFWLLTWAESVLGGLIKLVISEGLYVPGMGVVAGIAALLALGVLMNIYVFRRLVTFGEGILARIPLVKTIYGGIKDMMSFVAKDPEQRGMNQVVAVTFGENYRLIGFVTREDCRPLPDQLAPDGTVAVYFPLSYQIGGYTVFLPRERIEPIEELDMETGMRLALTAGVGTGSGQRGGEALTAPALAAGPAGTAGADGEEDATETPDRRAQERNA
jgi:uncharacterized membrane protein